MANDNISPVSLTPIGSIPPNMLPVWVDVLTSGSKPATYEDLYWFIEPTAEYVYFLAGNYEKSEHGYLAFGRAGLEARVEVSFEKDTISVHRIDDWRIQGYAEQNQQTVEEINGLTVAAVFEQLPNEGNEDGINNVMPFTSQLQPVSPLGMARAEFCAPVFDGRPKEVRMIYQALHSPEGQDERLLDIRVVCSDPAYFMSDLSALFGSLIARFSQLPYERLRGAPRY